MSISTSNPQLYANHTRWPEAPSVARVLNVFDNMDSSQAPLMSDERHEDELHSESDLTAAADGETGKSRDAQPGLFVVMLTFAAGISGLLFGCRFLQEGW